MALTSSTSEAYALLFKLLCDAGDAVLVPHPSYPLFEHLTQLESVTADAVRSRVSRRLADRHRFGRGALQPTACSAILIVSPNNPTGSFLHRDDLAALSELAAANGWAIIGDEVFADYPLDPAPAGHARAGGARRVDVQPRRPVEVRRPAASEARVDRLRRSVGEGRRGAGGLRD